MVRGKQSAERERVLPPPPPSFTSLPNVCTCVLRQSRLVHSVVPVHSPRDLSIHRDSHRVHCTTGATTLVEAERTSFVKGLDMPPPLDVDIIVPPAAPTIAHPPFL